MPSHALEGAAKLAAPSFLGLITALIRPQRHSQISYALRLTSLEPNCRRKRHIHIPIGMILNCLISCSYNMQPHGLNMVDNLTPEKRSKIMRAIKSAGTKPEMKIRALVRSLGYGYRLKSPLLPGRPDLLFPGKKKAIFVNGCFWHAHFCITPFCRLARAPDSSYWKEKLEKNITRDALAIEKLRQLGWETLTIWECELSDEESILNKLITFLSQ